jgi:hypothetical protein
MAPRPSSAYDCRTIVSPNTIRYPFLRAIHDVVTALSFRCGGNVRNIRAGWIYLLEITSKTKERE